MWKTKHLSMAGRATLAKEIKEAIPTYSMMSNMVPKSFQKDIQQIHLKFIWGDLEGKNKLHMASWDKSTKPKQV